MSPDDLERKLSERSFQPFRIKLSNSSTIDVTDPGEVVMGETSATFPMSLNRDTEGFRHVTAWRTVALSHMVEFTDLDPPKSESKRKRTA